MVHEHDALISEYSHEQSRPRAAEALHTLRRVATMVKPLMRQRGWRVGTLAEFYPSQQNLLGLNWNRGAKICLRLRYPSDANQFLPFENVLDTMLHELAHIEHGPHNQAFHALWDALRDEYEALLRKGYTGEGFLSKGRRLGGAGATSGEISRQRRAAAAAQRQQQGQLAQGSGRKLGGRRVRVDEDIRKVIADAAERRKEITQGCASGSSDSGRMVEEVGRNGFRTKAEEDEANEKAIMDAVIDLIQQEERERLGEDYIPPDGDNPAGAKGTERLLAAGTQMGATRPPPPPPPVPLATKPAPSSGRTQQSPAQPVPTPLAGPTWSCPICTLQNQPNHLCCDACGLERPSSLTASDYRDDTTRISLENARRGGGGAGGVGAATAAAASTSGQARRPGSHTSDTDMPTRPSKRPARAGDDSVLKPRSSRTSLAKIYESQASKPLGWKCTGCGSFMEMEWWTCSLCGRMKESS